ncbi:MAG: efflux transporter periplasmic adaptor subunit, partial [Gammaproteobacteria bacterium]|nr:efflux transporter periplasmic adaptor subunit [Gammaproteobacteria bacterium]
FRVITAFQGEQALQPGMFGRFRIEHQQREGVLTIPRGALLDDEGEPAVYQVRDGLAVRTPVQLGHVDAGFVEIRDGLASGDQVVIAGKGALRDGSAVQVIGADEAAVAAAPAEAAADTDDGNRQ